MSRISIVIPTLNEAKYLSCTLRHLELLDPPAWEVLVVDGGSEDETIAIATGAAASSRVAHSTADRDAQAATVQVLTSNERGRAVQMNLGAEAATGEILCFLHADTRVPDDLVAVIERTLADPAVACGGFISLMAGPETTRWGVSLHNFLKTYYAPLIFRPHLFFRGLRLLFGDQVMFCRRTDFWDCDGFSIMPILEEADLCLKLVRRGRIRQVNRVVQSSDRRVAHWGPLKATALYLYIGVLWGLGVSATYLKQFYDDAR